MPRIDVDHYSLEYIEHGTGDPLVLVHGSASDYRTWQGQLDTFSQQFRTIAYSRRYHWPNREIPDGADYLMAEHVSDLEALMHSLGAVPAHLVGHSYGAFVCLLLAIRSPQMVRSLVLTEPPAFTLFVSNTPKPGEMLRLLLSRPRTAVEIIRFAATGIVPASAAIKRGDREEALRAFGSATLGQETFRHLSKERLAQACVNLIKAELIGSGFPPLDPERVSNVRIPTLLVSGENSPGLFHCLLERIEELLPGSDRVEIPGASHIVHEDNTKAYNAAVLSFLDDLSPTLLDHQYMPRVQHESQVTY